METDKEMKPYMVPAGRIAFLSEALAMSNRARYCHEAIKSIVQIPTSDSIFLLVFLNPLKDGFSSRCGPSEQHTCPKEWFDEQKSSELSHPLTGIFYYWQNRDFLQNRCFSLSVNNLGKNNDPIKILKLLMHSFCWNSKEQTVKPGSIKHFI